MHRCNDARIQRNRLRNAFHRQVAGDRVIRIALRLDGCRDERDAWILFGVKEVFAPQVLIKDRYAAIDTVRIDRDVDRAVLRLIRAAGLRNRYRPERWTCRRRRQGLRQVLPGQVSDAFFSPNENLR